MPYIADGLLIESELAPLTRAALYGDGFFESMRIREGIILYFEDHYSRLIESCKILELSTESLPSLSELQLMIESLSHRCKAKRSGRIRMTFYRGGAGTYSPETNTLHYFIQCSDLGSEPDFETKGLNLGIFTKQAKCPGQYSPLKSISSQLYVMASIDAIKKNQDDTLVLNSSGRVVESSRCNVFCVLNDTVYTPPVHEGCVDGVMRRVLIRMLKENNIQVIEKEIDRNFLSTADEVFLSNIVRGVQWVKNIDEREYDNKLSLTIYKLLQVMEKKIINSRF